MDRFCEYFYLISALQFAASSRSSSAGTPGSPANSVRGGVYAVRSKHFQASRINELLIEHY